MKWPPREGGPNCRYALLSRDYLRADQAARLQWGAFKQRLARSVPDLLDYGQIKATATEILMIAAERWAAATGWQPPPGRPASRTSPARWPDFDGVRAGTGKAPADPFRTRPVRRVRG
ncbi:hypothetical protein [Streptomyces sp. NPDC004728]|uniref:hypothetical protein n=1 Tax=Streptomyces sp. NPDC004728 TaxID=3154289 RepID=UPI0033B16114